MKIGIVDVGGGYRGIYAAGVLDYCMDKGIRFDLGIGVSAGSANLISYAAGQPRRNYRFYSEFGLRKEHVGPSTFLKQHTFIDLDYMYSTLSNSDGEYPLDYAAVARNPMEFYVVATDAQTGDTKYFDKSDIAQDDYSVMKASSALPLVCHPYPVANRLYFDGALADPIPVQKAFDLGCDKVVVLLTKPETEIRTTDRDERLYRIMRRNYPNAAQQLRIRALKYNAGVALSQKYAAEGKVLIVAPDDTCGVNTLTRDKDALDRFYQKGYHDGEKIRDFLSAELRC